jgi:hypothetical protein
MKRIAVVTVVAVAFAVAAIALADGIGAVKDDMVVQIGPEPQIGDVVGFAICNTTADGEDTIQVQVHLQGAEPNTDFRIVLRNVFHPSESDDPVSIETVTNAGHIFTDSDGNGSVHAVTHVLEYGYADWVDMKVWAVAPGLRYGAWFAPPAGTELPPKP